MTSSLMSSYYEPQPFDRVLLYDNMRFRRVGGYAAPYYKNLIEALYRNPHFTIYCFQDSRVENLGNHLAILTYLKRYLDPKFDDWIPAAVSDSSSSSSSASSVALPSGAGGGAGGGTTSVSVSGKTTNGVTDTEIDMNSTTNNHNEIIANVASSSSSITSTTTGKRQRDRDSSSGHKKL